MSRNCSRAVTAARLAVAPMALLGFFLPWVEGPGVLAGQTFTGYELLDMATVLQAAGIDRSTTLWAAVGRLVLVLFAVDVVCHGLLAGLAPGGRPHAATGWVLAVIVSAAFAAAAWQTGLPLAGLWITAVAALLLAVTYVAERRILGRPGAPLY